MALELRARTGDQLGRLVAVAALEGEDAELRETQRVQRRGGDGGAPRAAREHGQRPVAVAQEVMRGALGQAAQRGARAVERKQPRRELGVLDHALEALEAQRGAQGSEPGQHRGRRVRRRCPHGGRAPVGGEVAAPGEQLRAGGGEREVGDRADLALGEALEVALDGRRVAACHVRRRRSPDERGRVHDRAAGHRVADGAVDVAGAAQPRARAPVQLAGQVGLDALELAAQHRGEEAVRLAAARRGGRAARAARPRGRGVPARRADPVRPSTASHPGPDRTSSTDARRRKVRSSSASAASTWSSTYSVSSGSASSSDGASSASDSTAGQPSVCAIRASIPPWVRRPSTSVAVSLRVIASRLVPSSTRRCCARSRASGSGDLPRVASASAVVRGRSAAIRSRATRASAAAQHVHVVEHEDGVLGGADGAQRPRHAREQPVGVVVAVVEPHPRRTGAARRPPTRAAAWSCRSPRARTARRRSRRPPRRARRRVPGLATRSPRSSRSAVVRVRRAVGAMYRPSAFGDPRRKGVRLPIPGGVHEGPPGASAHRRASSSDSCAR